MGECIGTGTQRESVERTGCGGGGGVKTGELFYVNCSLFKVLYNVSMTLCFAVVCDMTSRICLLFGVP